MSKLSLVSVISALLLLYFCWWAISVVGPVIGVEVNYQYRKVLKETFHVNDLRSLVWPQFEFNYPVGESKYKDYGINIPAIYLDERVIFNVDPNDAKAYGEALKKGIAQASATAFPDNPGLGYYFAHSSQADFHLQYNAVFYLLGKLKNKDDIYITYQSKTFHYQVIKTMVTNPGDVSFLHDEYPEETIVLQTCWPPGTSWNRLLVFAQRSK